MFLPALAMGCAGVVSGVSGAFPEPFVEINKLYAEGRIEEAQKVQKAGNEIITILKAGANMSYFKKALEYRGVQGGSMRSPHKDLTEAEKGMLLEEIRAWQEKHVWDEMSSNV